MARAKHNEAADNNENAAKPIGQRLSITATAITQGTRTCGIRWQDRAAETAAANYSGASAAESDPDRVAGLAAQARESLMTMLATG